MAFEAGQEDVQGRRHQAKAHSRVAGPYGTALRRGLAALAVVLAVACTPLYSNHGYVPEDKDLAELKTGVDTRDSVAAFLGRPSAEGLVGDVEWFYVQSRWKTVGGREPHEIDRQVVAISFDPNGKVSNVERFGLEKGQVIVISRRITTEPIKGRSALAQIFGAFGRIDPASLLKK
jgi:outer membrane protein assembly factor BamE (lipoprotein component of BamABCDE complex)